MKISLINGSPKRQESASELIIAALRFRLTNLDDTVALSSCHSLQGLEEVSVALSGSDAIVFVFPLYVDGIPSHLLRLMDQLSGTIAGLAPTAKVYAIVNNGFFEGEQNALALEMVQNFSLRAKLAWGQGLGVGAGGMTGTAPIGHGTMTNLGRALDKLAEAIISGTVADDNFIEPNFPRFAYKTAGDLTLRMEAKKNGVSAKQIHHAP
jgi:multimeric flavodoxin WrbA